MVWLLIFLLLASFCWVGIQVMTYLLFHGFVWFSWNSWIFVFHGIITYQYSSPYQYSSGKKMIHGMAPCSSWNLYYFSGKFARHTFWDVSCQMGSQSLSEVNLNSSKNREFGRKLWGILIPCMASLPIHHQQLLQILQGRSIEIWPIIWLTRPTE